MRQSLTDKSTKKEKTIVNVNIERDLFIVDEDEEILFLEGTEKYKLHKSKERNKEVIRLAKRQCLQKDKKLCCQVCGCSFVDTYGEIGHGFIEAHHIFPISLLKEETESKIEDLALVCSNCNLMLHVGDPGSPLTT